MPEVRQPTTCEEQSITRRPARGAAADCTARLSDRQGRHRPPKERFRVLVGDGVALVFRQWAQDLLHARLALGPGGVYMRVVAFPKDAVDADVMAEGDADRLLDHAEPEVPPEHLARHQVVA